MIKIETDDIIIYTTTSQEGNLALHTQDDYAKVIKNRMDFIAKISKKPSNFALANPTHSTRLIEMKHCDRSEGILELSKYDSYDALYTKEKDLFVGIFHADCTPVMLFAPDRMLVCAIHAGFKGTVDGIIINTIQQLQEKEDIDVKVLQVYIMPSISQKNYEISQQMALQGQPTNAVLELGNGHYYWDNHQKIIEQLTQLEIPIDHITVDETCTFDDSRFYSYRKDKTSYRNLSMISLK